MRASSTFSCERKDENVIKIEQTVTDTKERGIRAKDSDNG